MAVTVESHATLGEAARALGAGATYLCGGTIVMRAGMHGDFDTVGIEGVRDGTGTVVQLTVPIG